MTTTPARASFARTLLVLLLLQSCTLEDESTPLDGAVSEMAASLGASDISGRMKVIFTDFSGTQTGLSSLASDLLTEQLVKSGKFEILSPVAASEMARMHQTYESGLTDPRFVVRKGKLQEPLELLVGTADLMGRYGILHLKVVDLYSGQLIMSDSVRFQATPGLRELDRANSSNRKISKGPSFSFLEKFLLSNWQWLWTAILVPIAAWLIGRRVFRSEQNEPDES